MHFQIEPIDWPDKGSRRKHFFDFSHTWGIGKNGASPKVRQNRIIIDHGSFATNSLIAFSIGVISYKILISGLI